jgi:hypothetical protein
MFHISGESKGAPVPEHLAMKLYGNDGRKVSHSLHIGRRGRGQLHALAAVLSLKEFSSCPNYVRGWMNSKVVLDLV